MSDQENTVTPTEQPQQSEESTETGSVVAKLDAAEADIAADPSLTKEEKKEEIAKVRKLKLKVDGKEYEEELPFDLAPEHEEWMRKNLQLGKMGSKRAQESAMLRSEVEEFINQLKSNTGDILSKSLGIDMDELVTAHMEKKIARSKKTPAEIELEETRAELERIKREAEGEKDRKRKEEELRQEENEFRRYNEMMDSAFTKYSDVPDSDFTRRAVADYLILGFEQGMKLTPEQVMPLVKEDFENQIKSLFNKASLDKIESLLGEDKSKALRKKHSQKAKELLTETKKVEAQNSIQPKRAEETKKEDNKKIPIKDFFRF